MKILMVNKFLYPRGGAESYMLKLGAYYAALGHEVQYFGMYDEKNTVGNSSCVYTQNIDFHSGSMKKLLYPFKIIYSFEAKKKIGRVLDVFRPDVVHLNNINFQLTPSVIDAVKERGIPLFWTVHDYQLVCPNHLLYDFSKEQVCERCVGKGKRACFENRCIHGSRLRSLLGVWEAWLYRCRRTYSKVDRFICPSRFLEQRLLRDNASLFAGRTAVMHNFVDGRAPAVQRESRFPFPYVAFAGRLSAEKGTAVLAEAARLLPQQQFVVMGDGPEKDAFSGLPNVTLTGFLTGEGLQTNIACAAALCVPSVCFENCPLSILEARMLGTPSVTMPYGGMAELVEDGVTGTLSRSAAPADFAAAIEKTVADADRLRDMRENCRKAAEKTATLQEYGDALLKLYTTSREKQT